MKNVAQAVSERKSVHPEMFCRSPRCLWSRLSDRPCAKHGEDDIDRSARQYAAEWWNGKRWSALTRQERRDCVIEAAAKETK